jgi:prenyltransferase beta subunit
MSLRLEMLQGARLAPKTMGDTSQLVRDFIFRQQNADGGFNDRSGDSDLNYTVFALDALIALQADLPAASAVGFVQRFGSGEGLDFVHLCCLARAWAALRTGPTEDRAALIRRIETFRTPDGGYNVIPQSKSGTAYAAFLALGACQDLGFALPEPLKVVQSLKFLETDDGAWANDRSIKRGSTNATAAAITLLRHLQQPINSSVADWLIARAHPEGGFRASADAPIPDLLSTATALHALAGLQASFQGLREPCLDFIDTLWTNEGSFHGHWGDDFLDSEYTFYGLLALGNLSV